ncbi:MAG: amidohydrolase [Acidimicrobiales bacterium]|nr:amidohydrolase [Acidimicrobiales bacterium]
MADLLERILAYAGEKPELLQRGPMSPRERRYRIVSADDHLTEPPHMFEGRVPRRFADVAPRVERDEHGHDWWVFDHERVPLLGSDSWQGFEPGHAYLGQVNFDDLHPAVYDIHERVKHMDVVGVEASLNFASAPFGFAGTRFMKMHDPDAGLACMRAFNDWHLEEWASPYPGRIIPNQVTWLRDPNIAASEVRRNAERGFKALSFSENPAQLGLPSLYTEHWDPLLDACVETGTVINLHVGSSSQTMVPSADSAPAVLGALFPINAMAAAVDWVFSGALLRFPDLRIALSEGGIGWIPVVVDRIEIMSRQLDYPAQFGDLSPVDVLRRNFWFTALYEEQAMAQRHLAGVDHIMVEVDYPHSDSTWPDVQELLARQLAGVPDDEVAKMTHLNAIELYGLDR